MTKFAVQFSNYYMPQMREVNIVRYVVDRVPRYLFMTLDIPEYLLFSRCLLHWGRVAGTAYFYVWNSCTRTEKDVLVTSYARNFIFRRVHIMTEIYRLRELVMFINCATHRIYTSREANHCYN